MLRLAFTSSVLLAVANAQNKGIFVRWGHRECPDGSQLIYSGLATGSTQHWWGSGANDLCLHNHPEFPDEAKRRSDDHESARLAGTEYKQRDHHDPGNDQGGQRTHNQDAACAVCQSDNSGDIYVQWGRGQSCSNGHERMYSGYTMANRHNEAGKSEYVCVDYEKQYTTSSESRDEHSHDWYMAETRYGLDENLYPTGSELTCSVCLAPRSTFVRWGKKDCGNDAETLYEGFAASEDRHHHGSGYNAMCLHSKPELNPTRNWQNGNSAEIRSIEYWSYNRGDQNKANLVPNDSRQKDASCALCMAKEEGEVYVQWGRATSCSNQHKTMYNGLIMASHWSDDWKGEYVCVDPAMEIHKYSGPIGERDKGRTHRWYTTDATASSLDTAKYKRDQDLGCSVCLAPKKNVFVAWGKKECPDKDAQDLLYTGQVAGGKYDRRGSGANQLCLHNLPQSVQNANNRYQHHQSRIYGVEYWQNGKQLSRKNHQKDAACAVCSTKAVGETYVQWGRQTCTANYKEGTVNHTVVYKGMIYASFWNWQGKGNFECVHMDREYHLTSNNDPEKQNGRHENGQRWYMTELMTGAIADTNDNNGYRYGYELPCVVCQGEAAEGPPPTPAPTLLSTNTEFATLVENFNKLQKQVNDLQKNVVNRATEVDENIQTVIDTFNGKNDERVNDVNQLEETILEAVLAGHGVDKTTVADRVSNPNVKANDFEPTIEVDQGRVKVSVAPGNRLHINDGGADDEIYTAKEVDALVAEHVKKAFSGLYDKLNSDE